MRELGMVLVGVFAFGIFFSTMIYPNLEYTGYQSAHTCTGECYEEYVRTHGSVVEQLQAKQLAAGDPFSSIKPLCWMCKFCHGQEGQGIATFPRLAGQSSDYIVGRLISYKNRETIGAMSQTMWGQVSAMLSDSDIELLGEFIQETMK